MRVRGACAVVIIVSYAYVNYARRIRQDTTTGPVSRPWDRADVRTRREKSTWVLHVRHGRAPQSKVVHASGDSGPAWTQKQNIITAENAAEIRTNGNAYGHDDEPVTTAIGRSESDGVSTAKSYVRHRSSGPRVAPVLQDDPNGMTCSCRPDKIITREVFTHILCSKHFDTVGALIVHLRLI